MINLLFSFLFLLIHVNVRIQDTPVDQEVISKLTNYSSENLQEKVYIHTDKPYYVPGDNLWFKAYLMLGPYQIPDSISGVLYVELINEDETILDSRILHMREGLGWGDFALPASLEPGKYLLRAYTRYMQNYDPSFYYRKWVPVLSGLEEDLSRKKNRNNNSSDPEGKPIWIQFFPEGGDTSQFNLLIVIPLCNEGVVSNTGVGLDYRSGYPC